MIEGFKIVDMPNILTGGGPGTATQSLTLEAYLDWRALNLGSSAAIAYILLILVTIIASAYVALVAALGSAVLTAADAQSAPTPLAARPLARGEARSPTSLLIALVAGRAVPALLARVTSFKLPIQVDKGPFYIPFVDFQPTLDAWQIHPRRPRQRHAPAVHQHRDRRASRARSSRS